MIGEIFTIGGVEVILETVHMPQNELSLCHGTYGEMTCLIANPDAQKGDEFSLAGGSRFIVTEITRRGKTACSIVATAKTKADFESAIADALQ